MNNYETPILYGFVYKHGDKDFEAYQVELSDEDRQKIEEILKKYETDGCSTRNAYDCKISELF